MYSCYGTVATQDLFFSDLFLCTSASKFHGYCLGDKDGILRGGLITLSVTNKN